MRLGAIFSVILLGGCASTDLRPEAGGLTQRPKVVVKTIIKYVPGPDRIVLVKVDKPCPQSEPHVPPICPRFPAEPEFKKCQAACAASLLVKSCASSGGQSSKIPSDVTFLSPSHEAKKTFTFPITVTRTLCSSDFPRNAWKNLCRRRQHFVRPFEACRYTFV